MRSAAELLTWAGVSAGRCYDRAAQVCGESYVRNADQILVELPLAHPRLAAFRICAKVSPKRHKKYSFRQALAWV